MVPPSGPPQTGNLWVELGGNGKGPGSRVRGLSWVAGNRAASCHLLTQRQDYRGACACASTRNKQQADSGAHNHGLLQTLRSVVEARSKQEAIQKAQEAPIMRLCYQCSQGEPDEWSASGELDGVPFNLKAEIYDGS